MFEDEETAWELLRLFDILARQLKGNCFQYMRTQGKDCQSYLPSRDSLAAAFQFINL